MEKDLIDGKLGEKGAYDVEFKGGKLVAKADVAAGPLVASLHIEIGADALLDALAKAIPGQIDDIALNLIKAALKA